jgi:hypothetical protein
MLTRREKEDRALKLISEAGDEGLLQVEMWKRLGVNSKKGARIALNLEENGRVERKKELHEGRWTYRLFSTINPITIDSIRDCPCAACEDIERCIPGQHVSPIDCTRLTEWIHEGSYK